MRKLDDAFRSALLQQPMQFIGLRDEHQVVIGLRPGFSERVEMPTRLDLFVLANEQAGQLDVSELSIEELVGGWSACVVDHRPEQPRLQGKVSPQARNSG